MPERELQRQHAFQAYNLLDSLDPDALSAEMKSTVIWNRKELEAHATTYEQKRNKAVQPYLEVEDGEVQTVEEGDEVTSMEQALGVHLTCEDQEDWSDLNEKLNQAGNERVTVNIATVGFDEIEDIDLTEHLDVNGETENEDLLDRWHFMLDVNV